MGRLAFFGVSVVLARCLPLVCNSLLKAPRAYGANCEAATLVASAVLHKMSRYTFEMALRGRFVLLFRRVTAWVSLASERKKIQAANGGRAQ